MGLIKDAIRKASSITREEALKPTEQTEKDDRVIFSLTYNPRLPNINEKLSDLQPVLHASERCKNDLNSITAYCRNNVLKINESKCYIITICTKPAIKKLDSILH